MEYFDRYMPTELQTEYSELKKKGGSLTWKFLQAILPMESPRDSNRELRTVTLPIHHQKCRRNHQEIQTGISVQ
jgi:hypothetical protein